MKNHAICTADKLVLSVIILFSIGVFSCSTLIGCGGPDKEDLAKVRYNPYGKSVLPVSGPAEEGVDPDLVAELYWHAEKLDTIYSLLVVKNGKLIAEKYFHGAFSTKKYQLQSVTKSFVSALAGIALEKGYIKSLDEKMISYFPEIEPRIKDQRKKDITVRQMLQMRAGFIWEEARPEYFKILYETGFHVSSMLDIPLNKDPGSGMEYSNLTSHLLGIIISRVSGQDLPVFAQENLLSDMGISAGEWMMSWDNYYTGYIGLQLSAQDLAKFGILYLNGGVWEGRQLVPAGWVEDSLKTYSENAWHHWVGSNFKDIGYGYQWWSVRAGDHRYNLAWGHGGQQVALVHDQNMVIVVTADPFMREASGYAWSSEKKNLNLVADFIKKLP